MKIQNYSGRWLITGGLGFIGRRLTKHLLEHDGVSIKTFDNETVGQVEDYADLFDVEVITDNSSDWSLPGSKSVYHVKGDIRDSKAVEQVIKGANYIIHLAANTGVEPSMNNPQYDMESNVIGTFNILEAARHMSHPPAIVFASSNAPLGAAELRRMKSPRCVLCRLTARVRPPEKCTCQLMLKVLTCARRLFGLAMFTGQGHYIKVLWLRNLFAAL